MKFLNTSQKLSIEVRSAPAVESSKQFDASSLLPAFVGGLIVIAGWRVVEHYARTREKRSDLRESLKVLESTVDDIVDVATKFYRISGSAKDASALATLIKSKIQSLAPLIKLIVDSGVVVDATDEIKLFRQAVTGADFESVGRRVVPNDSAKFVVMEAAGQNLVQAVRLATFRTLVGLTRK